MADKKQIDLAKQQIWLEVLNLANTYTGAKFDRPLSIDQNHIINSCLDFILNYYSVLYLSELKTAFELAVAGKLKDCEIATYYGKFTVQTLSTVLNAYLVLRKQVQAEFQKIEDEAAKQKTEQEIADRNAKAIEDIKTAYQNLVSEFHLIGTIDESKIKPFWGKILVQDGIINFSADEKKDIYEESKKIVESEIRTQLSNAKNLQDRKELIKILVDVINQNEAETPNEDFITKAKNKYSHLIVVKSILNSHEPRK